MGGKVLENSGQKLFYKTNPMGGISLIVLIITIIVVIILAAAVIISLQNNNPMLEANKTRINSDVANMQAIFTNTAENSKLVDNMIATKSSTSNVVKDVQID